MQSGSKQHVKKEAYSYCRNYIQHSNTVPHYNIYGKYTRLTHPFNGPVSGTTRVSRYQKGKSIWILLKQETVSGSGISWAICKSAPRFRQITRQHPTTQFFTGRMPFLPPNQQRQSTEGIYGKYKQKNSNKKYT